MIRLFDLLFSILGILILLPVFLILLFVGFLDTGSPIFMQERVGRNLKPFNLFKFRSMARDIGHVATHLANVHDITRWGRFLRKSKLDELPQLFNVLRGDMSLVGPRPNLFNQVELINLRIAQNVYSVRPGITGEAQIKKTDMSSPELLARIDANMISRMNILLYFKIIFLTVFGRGGGDPIQSNYGNLKEGH